jgi:DNA-binding MarR family transcriptional regulator
MSRQQRATLETSPEVVTIGEVADSLKLRHHSAVELVDRAARAGLLVKAVDPDDARVQRLNLTADGEEKLSRLSAAHRQELRRFKEEMSVVGIENVTG